MTQIEGSLAAGATRVVALCKRRNGRTAVGTLRATLSNTSSFTGPLMLAPIGRQLPPWRHGVPAWAAANSAWDGHRIRQLVDEDFVMVSGVVPEQREDWMLGVAQFHASCRRWTNTRRPCLTESPARSVLQRFAAGSTPDCPEVRYFAPWKNPCCSRFPFLELVLRSQKRLH